jgi:hypothetical protein
MNPAEADLLPLPPEFHVHRNELRVVGYELVHYRPAFSRSQAERVRHSITEYEYGIHKIESIDDHGQLHVNPNPLFTSAAWIPNWTKHFLEKERPAGLGMFKAFFHEPARTLVTLAAPPYGLALLGLAAIADRDDARRQRERRTSLSRLSELPVFVSPYTRNKA